MITTNLLKRVGFTLVEVMVIIGIIAALAVITIPNLLRAKANSNATLAITTLRAISTAAETYSLSNSSNYPSNETVLTLTVPAYMNKSYCEKTISGYSYTCNFETSGYTIIATPTSSNSTTLTITTGGILAP